MESARFFDELPTLKRPLAELLSQRDAFVEVPADWFILLTDVRQSTRALSDGKHQVVNLVAAGSIISALNIARRAGASLPFFFGGDGATVLCPPTLVDALEAALAVHRANTLRNFDLDLRIGRVPMAEIARGGHTVALAKVEIAEGFAIPVALGEGLQHAERIIKRDDRVVHEERSNDALDLSGLECRWDAIRPPDTASEVICLLVVAADVASQGTVLSSVLGEIDRIYGALAERSPISLDKLRLDYAPQRIATEARARLGRLDVGYFAEQWLRTLIGELYFRFNADGRQYLQDTIRWSDTLMIDGRLNTVISGTPAQRARLTAMLDTREAAGALHYGMHVCSASVMSCYVRDRRAGHIHFIDGLGGGYTQAATMLKAKLAGRA